MADKRPISRKKNVESGGSGVNKRGSGLGTGPVGSSTGYSGRSSSSSGMKRAAAGGGGGLLIIIIAVIYMLLGGGGGNSTSTNNNTADTIDVKPASQEVDTSVIAGSRAKYTTVNADGSDQVTMLVYMCGTDLESKHGMASNDLNEMLAADLSDKLNIIVYTGGCKYWKTSGIRSDVNQIYQVTDKGLKCLVENDGDKAMTDPSTLSSFIKWGTSKFPADRYELIFWDHGGGSVSGYGYDEKNSSSGSMALSGINTALKDGGVKFDFVGFDACLMATAETALMLDPYADYMIASEETEPGIGWYYTNWVSKFSADTSLSTLEVGKMICDDFTSACSQKCRGQKTTLSVIDLAEFAFTVPSCLTNFSNSISTKLKNKEYKEISDARYVTREFAESSKIDQVDLVNLCENVDTTEAAALKNVLKSAVKYNRYSTTMSNANGVSIYFPYKRTSYVDKACKTYDQIGMSGDYGKCIKQFAAVGSYGQAATGGSQSPVNSLLGNALSGSSSDMIGDLLTGFLSNRSLANDELNSSNTEFLDENPLSEAETESYIKGNLLDASSLFWTTNSEGQDVISISEKQLDLVHDIDLNMFYDDGEGYVDLGLDNVFSYDDDGNIVAETDRTWIAINKQIVPYYHTDTTDLGDIYTITGRVPCIINGEERANLILVFDTENPDGYIAGAVADYVDGETDTVAKSMIELNEGDQLDFVCDYYDYNGNYQDSYYLGDTMTVTDEMKISNVSVGDGPVKITYRLTDIYNQEYWTEALDK
ncbi:MAG: peptidase C11 [Lachnospiraceae bacterium]|nr:peptidase C11 [Lachnospiraceae bacterium]